MQSFLQMISAQGSNTPSSSTSSSNNHTTPSNVSTTQHMDTSVMNSFMAYGSPQQSTNSFVVDQSLLMKMMNLVMNTSQNYHDSDAPESNDMTDQLLSLLVANSTPSDLPQQPSNMLSLIIDSMKSPSQNEVCQPQDMNLLNTASIFNQSRLRANSSPVVSTPKSSQSSCSSSSSMLDHFDDTIGDSMVHMFIKKGAITKKGAQAKNKHLHEQLWHRLHTSSSQTQSVVKQQARSICLIGTDQLYYILVVLPRKLYQVSDLNFLLEQEETQMNDDSSDEEDDKKKKRKRSQKRSDTSHPLPIEMKIRGKDISNTTKMVKQLTQSNQASANQKENEHFIMLFEVLAASVPNRKKSKKQERVQRSFNVIVQLKQETLLRMKIHLHNQPSKQDSILDLTSEIEEISCASTSTANSQKKRKKGSQWFGNNDEEEELETIPEEEVKQEGNRKRSKSSVPTLERPKTHQLSPSDVMFEQMKQWIIVTVFKESTCIDMTKFPHVEFPKQLAPRESFLLYVDIPMPLSQDHDICFKILDSDTKQELSFSGDNWIETNVVNCCNFNIHATLVSLHVEYMISFADISYDRPLVFLVALKDKKSLEERVIYQGNSFNIVRRDAFIQDIDELGVSSIQQVFDNSIAETSAISEIFEELPNLSVIGDPFSSEDVVNFNLETDDFERLFGDDNLMK